MLDIKSGARANGNSAAMKGVMHLVSDDGDQGAGRLHLEAQALIRDAPARLDNYQRQSAGRLLD
jgi:hypothetical protein